MKQGVMFNFPLVMACFFFSSVSLRAVVRRYAHDDMEVRDNMQNQCSAFAIRSPRHGICIAGNEPTCDDSYPGARQAYQDTAESTPSS